MKRYSNLLISIEDLRAGGAQTFALRFAEFCSENDHHVYLFQHYNWLIDKTLLNDLAPSVTLIQYHYFPDWLDKLFFRLENLLQHLFWFDFQPRKRLLALILKKAIVKYKIDAVFSHTLKSDYVCANALNDSNIPFFITMHGDYDEFYEFSHKKNKINSFLRFIKKIYSRTNFLIYLSEKNLFTIKLLSFENTVTTKKIYNGFKGKFLNSDSRSEVRKKLNIAQDALTFVMVARGVEGKGWKELIESFKSANISNAHLVLIGSGDFLEHLRKEKKNDKIHFIGNHPNPIDIIKACDVGVLPSKLKESLPNSIIEYLFCGLPVIATDAGEVKNMILANSNMAGIIIPFPSDKGSYNNYQKALTDALITFNAEEKFLHFKQYSSIAFQKFTMSDCYHSYFSLILKKDKK